MRGQKKKRGDIMPRKGRPKSDNPRNRDINIRLTVQEKELIEECAKKYDVTRTDAIMMGIKLLMSDADLK